VPGDVYYAGADQAWEYDNLTTLWAPDLDHSADALATLKRGGYFSAQPVAGLTVLSLNINYWATMNPQLDHNTSLAYAEGQAMFEWLNTSLAAAAASNDAVHILGHQPPTSSPGGGSWLPGYYAKFSAWCSEYKDTIKAQFFGHIHTDQWTLTRECTQAPPGSPYVETSGIKWCSGGGDYAPGDAFGAGVNDLCPILPANWTDDAKVAGCERVCSDAKECVGFTFYPTSAPGGKTECCFRTESTASKPACPACSARCYEKPGGYTCDSSATTLILPGPSLTEGWPATNPSVRELVFDAKTFELLDAKTYTADLHAANKPGGTLEWGLEYSFVTMFGMKDMSVEQFEQLHAEFSSSPNSSKWSKYMGQGDGSLFCKGYNGTGAPFPPVYPCKTCEGACKTLWINTLNGTNVPA
jgi:hypothetical protein